MMSLLLSARVVRDVRSWCSSKRLMLPGVIQEILQVVNHLLVVFGLLNKIHTFQDIWVAGVSLVELVTDTCTTAIEIESCLCHLVVSDFITFWRFLHNCGLCPWPTWSKPREALGLHGRLADVFADVQRWDMALIMVDSLTGLLFGDFIIEDSCVAKATWQVNWVILLRVVRSLICFVSICTTIVGLTSQFLEQVWLEEYFAGAYWARLGFVWLFWRTLLRSEKHWSFRLILSCLLWWSRATLSCHRSTSTCRSHVASISVLFAATGLTLVLLLLLSAWLNLWRGVFQEGREWGSRRRTLLLLLQVALSLYFLSIGHHHTWLLFIFLLVLLWTRVNRFLMFQLRQCRLLVLFILLIWLKSSFGHSFHIAFRWFICLDYLAEVWTVLVPILRWLNISLVVSCGRWPSIIHWRRPPQA